jgi:hypothetical protein
MKSIKITLKLLVFMALLAFPCFVPTVAKAATNDYFQINIDRVFMHVPGDYSVAYTGIDKVVTIERMIWDDPMESPPEFLIKSWVMSRNKNWVRRPAIKSVIIADVSHGEPMYAKVTGDGSSFVIALHIHSAEEIGGGEWSTGGKHPQKQDTVIVQ